MKQDVVVLGSHIDIEILGKSQLLKMDVRYVCTDFESGIDVYESNEDGEFMGCPEE